MLNLGQLPGFLVSLISSLGQVMEKNTTAMIIASQNQDYVDEGLAEYQDQIHKLQSKSIMTIRILDECSSAAAKKGLIKGVAFIFTFALLTHVCRL